MSDIKISNLPAAGSVGGSDLVVVVQGGTTKKATVSQLPTGASIPGAAHDVLISDGAGGVTTDTGNCQVDPTNHTFIANVNNTANAAGASAFGDSSTASGICAFATGDGCVASGDESFTCGSACTAAGLRSFAGGEDTSTDGSFYDQFAYGQNCQANNFYAVALGYHSVAAGEGSIVTGLSGSATMFGERAHNSLSDGTGTVQDYHAVAIYVEASAAPAIMALGSGGDIGLPLDETNYYVTYKVIASLTGTETFAVEEHRAMIQSHSTALILPPTSGFDVPITPPDNDLNTTGGWSLTMSNPGGLDLEFTFDPGGNDVKVLVLVEWSSVPNI